MRVSANAWRLQSANQFATLKITCGQVDADVIQYEWQGRRRWIKPATKIRCKVYIFVHSAKEY
jgi:hypothetical protein